MNQHKQLFSAAGRCGLLAGGVAVRRHGGGTGGVPCFAGAGGAHSFAAFAAGRVLAAGGFQLRAHSAGFGLGVAVSIVLAVAAQAWHTAEVLLAPVLQLVKPRRWQALSFWRWCGCGEHRFRCSSAFLMVLPVLYGAVRTGIRSADPQLLEMTKVFRLPFARCLRAVWLPAVLPAFRQGCSVALGICWKSGVAAEVIGLPNGSIGDALYRAKITLSTGELFAWTFVDHPAQRRV